MELFSIACSTCRARLKVTDPAAIGHILACPKCGGMVQVTPPADWRPVATATAAAEPTAASVFEGGPTVAESQPSSSATVVGDAPANAAGTSTRLTLWTGLSAGVLCVAAIAAVVFWSPRAKVAPQLPPIAQEPDLASVLDAPNPVDEPASAVPNRLNLRWLPDDAQRIVSVRWNETAAQPAVHAILSRIGVTSGAPDKLLAAAGLEPAHIHRLTWAGRPNDDWLTQGVTIIELESPRPEALPGTARGTPLDLKLGDGVCHQPAASLWPHPWVQADLRTIVTGPLPNLQRLAQRSEINLQHPGVARLVRAVTADHHVTLVMPWGVSGARSEPAGQWLDTWFSAQPDWAVLRDEPLALALAVDFNRQVQAEFALLLTTQATADEAHAALESVLEGAEAQLAATTVVEQGALPEDLQQQTLTAVRNRQTGVAFPTVWGRLAWEIESTHWADAVSQAVGPAKGLAATGDELQPAAQITTVLKPPSDPQPSTLNPQPADRRAASNNRTDQAPLPGATALGAANAPSALDPRPPTLDPQPTEERLADRIPAIEFNQIALAELVDLLKDLTGLRISIDLQGLAEVGVSPDDPVSANLANTSVAQVLDDALSPLKLGFVLENNQVLITNTRRQRDSLSKVEYAVSDLAVDGQAVKELAGVFERLVDPSSWQAAGGKGTIEVTGARLLVSQNRAVHRQLQQMCDKLRLARGLTPKATASGLTLDTRTVQSREPLQRPVTANFPQEAPLGKILSHLQRSTNCTILVDSTALADEGLSPEMAATLKVTKQPLSETLASLLEPLGLGWQTVDDHTFLITTQSAAAAPELEFHRAADLLGPNQTAAQLVDRIGQAFAAEAGAANSARPVVHFDQRSAYLLVFTSQRDQAQLESLLNSWRTPVETPDVSRE